MEKKEFTHIIGNGLFETISYEQRDEHHFHELPETHQQKLLDWIEDNFIPASRSEGVVQELTTYTIKQHFTNAGRGPFFVYDNQMKEAFWKAGFRPAITEAFHWTIRLSPRSPYLHNYRNRKH